MGRKSKYDPATTPSKAEELAKDLLTDAQICANLGISYETFYLWQKRYPEFLKAVKRGKQEANRDLVDVMKKSAKGYYVEEEETVIYLTKDKKPKSYSKVVKKRYIPPSTTTQIFLAKNRMPEDFRDVHRQEHERRTEDTNASRPDDGRVQKWHERRSLRRYRPSYKHRGLKPHSEKSSKTLNISPERYSTKPYGRYRLIFCVQ